MLMLLLVMLQNQVFLVVVVRVVVHLVLSDVLTQLQEDVEMALLNQHELIELREMQMMKSVILVHEIVTELVQLVLLLVNQPYLLIHEKIQ